MFADIYSDIHTHACQNVYEYVMTPIFVITSNQFIYDDVCRSGTFKESCRLSHLRILVEFAEIIAHRHVLLYARRVDTRSRPDLPVVLSEPVYTPLSFSLLERRPRVHGISHHYRHPSFDVLLAKLYGCDVVGADALNLSSVVCSRVHRIRHFALHFPHCSSRPVLADSNLAIWQNPCRGRSSAMSNSPFVGFISERELRERERRATDAEAGGVYHSLSLVAGSPMTSPQVHSLPQSASQLSWADAWKQGGRAEREYSATVMALPGAAAQQVPALRSMTAVFASPPDDRQAESVLHDDRRPSAASAPHSAVAAVRSAEGGPPSPGMSPGLVARDLLRMPDSPGMRRLRASQTLPHLPSLPSPAHGAAGGEWHLSAMNNGAHHPAHPVGSTMVKSEHPYQVWSLHVHFVVCAGLLDS